MSVLKVKDADGNWVGVTAIKGDRGDSGFSPKVAVNTNTSSTYKLRITTEDRDFITPNLKGQGGANGFGNTNAELGTVVNYKKFDGNCIPPYNGDMPPLPCFRGTTIYEFDHEVTMLIYAGEPDSNGNYNVENYVSFTGSKIEVPTYANGFLTDYVIYNAVPKKSWDTWENPNLLNILPPDDPSFALGSSTMQTYLLPNLKAGGNRFKGGDAYIDYTRHKNGLNKYETRDGDYDMAVYYRKDFPFALDEPFMFSAWDTKENTFRNPVEIPYPSEAWNVKMNDMPRFKVCTDCTINGLALEGCGPEKFWGNTELMTHATAEKEKIGNREYDFVIADPKRVNKYLAEYNAQPIAPAMYVGLEKSTNYTIESTAGDCAIVLSPNIPNVHVTKSNQLCYPSTVKTATVKKKTAQEIGEPSGGLGGGTVSGKGSSKLESGSVIYYDVVNESTDPVGTMDIPTALSCPNVYLKRGEKYTFYVNNDDDMFGIWICCHQEEDYAGIKIVKGVEPYSALMSERIASGATKFNVKVRHDSDPEDILAEYNVKLSDTTEPTDYCRLLTNNTIKNYRLDDFSMEGHDHKVADITDMEERLIELKVPKMILGTSTLVDGESELPENNFYFVYEE